jgi:hypothetical protein
MLLAPLALAETFKCNQSTGCEVRLWNPNSQEWGEPEEVPDGTIVDSKWAMPWGEGWGSIG